jgi:membrane-associated phospholipid phosphatase
MDIILIFQNLGDWLVPAAKFFSFLGSDEFYLLIIPAMYWCIDRPIGARMAVLLFVTASVSDILKLVFHSPRPFWVSRDIKALSAETSFGFPSNHAQIAVVLWGTWAASLRKAWVWLIAGFFVLMIGLSRVALGVHFPNDVIFGWVIGALLLLAFSSLEKPFLKWLNSLSLSMQIVIIFIFALAILLSGILMISLESSSSLPAEWIDNGSIAGATPDPFSLDVFSATAGGFFGIALGLILINRWGGFSPKGKVWKRIVRYMLGMVGIMILYAGLKAVFPSGDDILPQALRIVRYICVTFWLSAGAPWLFLKLNLVEPTNTE